MKELKNVLRKITALVLCAVLVFTTGDFFSSLNVNAWDYISKGIDVSSHQGAIDWVKVTNNGIDFAIIRSGYGKYVFQEDKNFRSNYSGAKNAGIKVGTYWVSYAMSTEEAYEEAEICYSIIKEYSFDYPVYYDMEVSSQSSSLSKQQITNIGLAFCERLASRGYKVGIYANKNWFTNFIDKDQIINKGYEIWLAQYPSGDYAVNPELYDKSQECGVWQYSSKGGVGGISGYVDVNVSYVDYGLTVPCEIQLSGFQNPVKGYKHTPGANCGLYGTITSSHSIVHVWGGVYNLDGTPASGQSTVCDDYPNTTSYSLRGTFNNTVIFDDIPEGNYVFCLSAEDNDGYSKELIHNEFTIGDPVSTEWYESLNPVQLGESFDAIILNKNCWKPIRTDSTTNVVLHEEEWVTSEMWRFTLQPDGSYKIVNFENGLCLDADSFGTDNGTNIGSVQSNDSQAQRWYLYAVNGGYVFRPAYGCLVMDLSGNNSGDNTNIQLCTYEGNDAQIFSIYTNNVLDYAKPSPTAPKLTVEGNASITINWDKTLYTEKYDVYRSMDQVNWVQIAETDFTAFTDNNISPNTKYYYYFDSVNRFYQVYSPSSTATIVVKPVLSVDVSSVNLKVGETHLTKVNQTNVIYKSSDENIATVSSDGVITGVGAGEAFILIFNEDYDVVQVKVTVESNVIAGDCNSDGQFTVADIIMLQQWLINGNTVVDDWKAADLSEDGRLNTMDLVLMKRKLINQ